MTAHRNNSSHAILGTYNILSIGTVMCLYVCWQLWLLNVGQFANGEIADYETDEWYVDRGLSLHDDRCSRPDSDLNNYRCPSLAFELTGLPNSNIQTWRDRLVATPLVTNNRHIAWDDNIRIPRCTYTFLWGNRGIVSQMYFRRRIIIHVKQRKLYHSIKQPSTTETCIYN